MRLIKKNLISFFALALGLMPVLAKAQDQLDLGIGYGADTGLGSRDVRSMIATIINVLLGFLGIVVVVIIILGGFKWMTAAGNEEKVGEAKKLIGAGIIGLVIILAAYAIATYVVDSLVNATSDNPV